MNEKEIREKWGGVECKTQMEFDHVMAEINEAQGRMNRPYLDREFELAKRMELLKQQKQAINIQMAAIKVERVDMQQRQKEINRVFHDVKHSLIMKNPRGKYGTSTAD